MYTLLALTTNNGAIGLMQDLLWHWVPMFLACSKHKYATHLSKFLQDLQSNYSPQLMHAIEMNWLCNPAGKRDRKSTRLNSSHQIISYAVFCLKKKKKNDHTIN